MNFKQWCMKCGDMTYHNSGGCSKCSERIIVTNFTTIINTSQITQKPEYNKLVNENLWDLV